jgi:hypothetical protein
MKRDRDEKKCEIEGRTKLRERGKRTLVFTDSLVTDPHLFCPWSPNYMRTWSELILLD